MEEIDIISSVEYAIVTLNALVVEMEERYEKLKNAGMRTNDIYLSEGGEFIRIQTSIN